MGATKSWYVQDSPYMYIATFEIHWWNTYMYMCTLGGNVVEYFHTHNPTMTLKFELRPPKGDTSEILSMVTIYILNWKSSITYFGKYSWHDVQSAIFSHISHTDLENRVKVTKIWYIQVPVHGYHMSKFESHPYKKLLEISWTHGIKCNIFTLHPAVTSKIERKSPKVDTSEILAMVIIYPNLKAISDIL